MWPNPQETANLVTFTEEKILNEKFIYCAVSIGFSAIDLSVFALWSWNFLTHKTYLLDILEQTLEMIASPRLNL